MGKSRLVSTTIRRARDRGIATFVGECQPHGGRLAYLPWHTVWAGLLGLPADASPDAQREALVGGLSAVAPNLVPLAPLLGTVLDLPMADNDATRSMPAVVRKQVLEQVLTGLLRGRAAGGPVCIVLEDLHWMDGLSRDLLATLAAAIADVPVLFVLSYRRPEAGPPIELAPGSEHVLGELTADEATDLATMLLTHVTEEIPDAAPRGGHRPRERQPLLHRGARPRDRRARQRHGPADEPREPDPRAHRPADAEPEADRARGQRHRPPLLHGVDDGGLRRDDRARQARGRPRRPSGVRADRRGHAAP